MKLVTFIHLNRIMVGGLGKRYIYPLPFNSMNEIISSKFDVEDLCAMAGNPIAKEETKLISPIPAPKQDIICLGINYLEHAAESARFKNKDFDGHRSYAVYFSKRVNECVGTGGVIQSHKDIVDSLDYECELAVIIRDDCKNVKKEEAFDHIFGYTIMNDISARNLQSRHNQWYFGKSLDSFTPLGPYIVTEDEFKRPPELNIRSYVNGEKRQDSNTSLFIFDIPHVISELSHGMTLKSGTIISMGTPAGVGMGFKPPKWLKKGDVVECEIEGIGILRNYVE